MRLQQIAIDPNPYDNKPSAYLRDFESILGSGKFVSESEGTLLYRWIEGGRLIEARFKYSDRSLINWRSEGF